MSALQIFNLVLVFELTLPGICLIFKGLVMSYFKQSLSTVLLDEYAESSLNIFVLSFLYIQMLP